MASFLVLSPEAANGDPMEDRFVRDGFFWLAALFPVPWAIAHGLYLDALGLILLRGAAWIMLDDHALFVLGLSVLGATSLIYGFEGRNRYAGRLARDGFRLETAIWARGLYEAEQYFYGDEDTGPSSGQAHESSADLPPAAAAKRPSPPTLGMISFEKGRR